MIRKKITAAIIILIGFLLQTSVFRSFELANVVPNMLLIVTVSYAYLRGRTSGLLIGFVCGLLLDMYCGSVMGLYAFIFRVSHAGQTGLWLLFSACDSTGNAVHSHCGHCDLPADQSSGANYQ